MRSREFATAGPNKVITGTEPRGSDNIFVLEITISVLLAVKKNNSKLN